MYNSRILGAFLPDARLKRCIRSYMAIQGGLSWIREARCFIQKCEGSSPVKSQTHLFGLKIHFWCGNTHLFKHFSHKIRLYSYNLLIFPAF